MKFKNDFFLQLGCTIFLLDYYCFNVEALDDPIKFAPRINFCDRIENRYFPVNVTGSFLRCKLDSHPPSKITWTFNGKEIEPPLKIARGENYKDIHFPIYQEHFAGDYLCTAENNLGKTYKIFKVRTIANKNAKESDLGTVIIVAIVFSIIIVLALSCIVVAWAIRRLRSKLKEEQDDNQIVCIKRSDEPNGTDKIFELAYDPKYEIQKDQFQIEFNTILGIVPFPRVYSGTVKKGNFSGRVSFKMNPSQRKDASFINLLRELKMMIFIGEHENIVRLIGVYSQEIQQGIIYIATELCILGSLEKYLRQNRARCVANANDNYAIPSQTELTCWQKTLSKSKLCNWSSQIANGMEYLASKNVVHCDLATRNVLIDSAESVKITGFELSGVMDGGYNYVQMENTHLPWKWMACESLRTKTFSTQSDVWAFGITMWEMFSGGDAPYPTLSWSDDFIERIEDGFRNPKPELADTKIYDAMISCWNNNPNERPTFNYLKLLFKDLADDDSAVDRKVQKKMEDKYPIEKIYTDSW